MVGFLLCLPTIQTMGDVEIGSSSSSPSNEFEDPHSRLYKTAGAFVVTGTSGGRVGDDGGVKKVRCDR